jgi:hypothetical protein
MSIEQPESTFQDASQEDLLDVMHLEDDPASAAGFAAQSSLAGIHVDLIEDVGEARSRLRRYRYRLLVIDLEVLEDGKRRLGAGADVIEELVRGEFDLNVATPILVHTAHLGAFEDRRLSRHAPRIELVRKPASVYTRATEIVRPIGRDRVLVEVLPATESSQTTRGILVRVPGWRNEPFEVPMTFFGGDQLIDVVLAESSMYFAALANLDAEKAEELGLRILELVQANQPEGFTWED